MQPLHNVSTNTQRAKHKHKQIQKTLPLNWVTRSHRLIRGSSDIIAQYKQDISPPLK